MPNPKITEIVDAILLVVAEKAAQGVDARDVVLALISSAAMHAVEDRSFEGPDAFADAAYDFFMLAEQRLFEEIESRRKVSPYVQ